MGQFVQTLSALKTEWHSEARPPHGSRRAALATAPAFFGWPAICINRRIPPWPQRRGVGICIWIGTLCAVRGARCGRVPSVYGRAAALEQDPPGPGAPYGAVSLGCFS